MDISSNIIRHQVILQAVDNLNNIELYDSIHLIPLGNIHSEIHTSEYAVKHRHEFYEVVYCLSGTFTQYYYENYHKEEITRYNSVTAKRGTVLIVPPNCVHYFKFTDSTEPVSYINIQVSNKAFLNLTSFFKMQHLQNVFSCIHGNSQYFNFENFFEDIYSNEKYSIKQRASLNYILLSNILSTTVLQHGSIKTQPDWFKNITVVMNNPNNYNKSLHSLAQVSGYSYSQLSKLFKQYSGVSLCSYFIRSKMKYAVYLLKHTDWKIIDIALILGYNNCSFFTKTFFQHFNVTPSEYRNKYHSNK